MQRVAVAEAKSKSLAYTITGYVVLIGSVAAFLLAPINSNNALLILPIILVALFVAMMMFEKGGRLRIKSAAQLLASDRRPPVIYLRSFADETAHSSDRPMHERLRHIFGYSLPGVQNSWRPREQHALSNCLGRIGPYIAIGRPGEPLPEFGAGRRYVPDEDWQRVVTELIENAGAIVIDGGTTAGLRWELLEAVLRAPPTKLLIVVPAWPTEYAMFQAWANKVLLFPLPEKMPKSRLVMFAFDGTPVPLEPYPRTLPSLLGTLRPFLEQNGVRLSRWETG